MAKLILTLNGPSLAAIARTMLKFSAELEKRGKISENRIVPLGSIFLEVYGSAVYSPEALDKLSEHIG